MNLFYQTIRDVSGSDYGAERMTLSEASTIRWGVATSVQLLLRFDAALIPRDRLTHLQLVQRDQLITKPVVESYVVELTHALLWAPVN